MSRLPRPTRRGWCLITAGLTFVVGGALSGFADVIRAGVFALVLVALAAGVTFVRPARLAVSRRVPEQLQAGRPDRIDLTVEVPSSTWVSTRLRDPHTFSTTTPAQWDFDRLVAGSSHLPYQITPPHRGEFTAGPLIMQNTDPLRLVHCDSTQGELESWLVWPRIHDIDGSGGRRLGEGEDELISAHASQSGHSGASIREYAQGDDMRLVHWPATAQRGELMMRQFDPPAQSRTRILVHGDVPRPGTDQTWETLISLAASTCVHLGQHGTPLSVSVGSQHLESVREALDALAAVTSSTPSDTAAAPAPTLLFHHTSVPVTLTPPRHVAAWALVAGHDSTDAATELSDLGWHVEIVRTDVDPADVLTRTLSSFGVSR